VEFTLHYNGYYCATGENLYNTWSIIRYLKEKKIEPYWVMTAKSDNISKLLTTPNYNLAEDIEKLALSNARIKVPLSIDIELLNI